jgi:hypothetical protein
MRQRRIRVIRCAAFKRTLVTAPFERCYKITNLPLCVCRERINVVQE